MEHKHGAYFISGVDTDCGKTYVTGCLAAYLRHRGVNVITQKPVQTGCETVADDLVEHRKAMGVGIQLEDKERRTCSYLFRKPASPQLAARLEGVTIDVNKISSDTEYLLSKYDVVLVEGAGGLMVPLNDDYLNIDYVSQQKLPLVLVTSSKLGGINHALLSMEACKNRNIDIKCIVFNRMPKDDPILADDAYQVIKKYALRLYPDIKVIDFRSSDSFWGEF
ncbi:MAG: dethiobiotin synthase [Bacteroidia bacterium]|nr:dethiobiotin synthase [Bacteroidia bacterium]